MKPPASRPRSQSQTRKTDDSDQVIFKTHGQSYNMENLIESTLLKQNVLQNIIPSIVKETTQELKSDLQSIIRSAVAEAVADAVIPLKLRIDEQDQKLITLFDRTKTENEVLMKKIGEKESKIVSYEKVQGELVSKNSELQDDLTELYYQVEELEQYGRRTSLRFHNVPMQYSDLQKTDQKVLDIVNNKLNLQVVSPLTADDINRSHIIGPIREGKGQIICRFRNWKIKNIVYSSKKRLKNNFERIFITEDLTKTRQNLVKRLNARKKAKEIHSFWTFDGRTYAKKTQDSAKVMVKSIEEINNL
ncbi:HSPA4 [Mytilus coruscus]|uniref:HSPA4 n=1 Tax=Mytilus coruscus TaxID=42192 RepID=A0A6J8F510_MYTCO|nr:HSPA4 [Mytilus coruscus]